MIFFAFIAQTTTHKHVPPRKNRKPQHPPMRSHSKITKRVRSAAVCSAPAAAMSGAQTPDQGPPDAPHSRKPLKMQSGSFFAFIAQTTTHKHVPTQKNRKPQ